MTIVRTPMLELHYTVARDQSSWNTAWSFWQVALQNAFDVIDTYNVTAQWGNEYNDDSHQADILVQRLDADMVTNTVVLLCFQCRRDNSDTAALHEAERQALDACRRRMQRTSDKARQVWAMTTIGLSFRLWLFDASNDQLVPEHGPNTVGADQSLYIDAKSAEAVVLYSVVEKIKAHGDASLCL